MPWRRILKWFLYTSAALALILLVFVWAVLGVNPFEGDEDQLYKLVSHEVQVFMRFPGGRLLDQPLVKNLGGSAGYEAIEDLRDQLADAALQIAEDVNPNIPGGIIEIDLKRDLLDKEMAIAGSISDYTHPRFDHFIALVRIPFYARYLSALKRGFVSSNLPSGAEIEVKKGLYFKMRLPPATVDLLRPLRSVMAREEDDVLYLARIKDVLLISDNEYWIQHAFQSRLGATLPADSFFETEFMASSKGGPWVETYLRGDLARGFFTKHSRGVLRQVNAVLPYQLAGEMTLRAFAPNGRSVELDWTNRPGEDAFQKAADHVNSIFDSEKADVHYDLSTEGLGKFIPRDRVVGAMVMRMSSRDLVETLLAMMSRDDIQLADEGIRETSRTSGLRYSTLREMLSKLATNFGDSLLFVAHRPAAFDSVDYSRLFDADDADEFTPEPQLAFSVVLKVKDNLIPGRVAAELGKHMPLLAIEPAGSDPSHGLHFGEPEFEPEGLELLAPAYGALPVGKYIVVSTLPAAAAAIVDAAKTPEKRLLPDPRVTDLVKRLPLKATMAFLVLGDGLKRHLLDGVRAHCEEVINMPGLMADIQRRFAKARKPQPTHEEAYAMARADAEAMYPSRREDYEASLIVLDPIEAIVGSLTLGVTTHDRAIGKIIVGFAFQNGENGEDAEGDDGSPETAEAADE